MISQKGWEKKEMEGLFDLHSHILPKVDDGAKDIEETKRLIDMAYEQGIRHIAATPHYIKGYNTYTTKELLECFEMVKKMEEERHKDLQLYLGHEVFYTASMIEDLREGEIQTLNGGRFVLVEFSTNISYTEMQQAIKNITLSCYYPIIAHMERYDCLFKKRDRVRNLRKMGAVFQMNTNSLIGGFFDARARECQKLILDGEIQLLGTDMHSSKHRPPQMDEAVKWLNKKLPGALRKQLLYENPNKILHSES